MSECKTSFLCSCRMEEFYSIVPRQPYRPEDTPSEVRLEFEAVLLDGSANNPTSNQLWIHARIKACVNGADCVPVRIYLIDLWCLFISMKNNYFY